VSQFMTRKKLVMKGIESTTRDRRGKTSGEIEKLWVGYAPRGKGVEKEGSYLPRSDR